MLRLVAVPLLALILVACTAPGSSAPTPDACSRAESDLRRLASAASAMPGETSQERVARAKRLRAALQIAIDNPTCFASDVVAVAREGIAEIDKELAKKYP